MNRARLTVHFTPDDAARELRNDALAGLTAQPRWLSPKWFYDAAGSELFEHITKLPEYYQTRAEHEILSHHAGEIAERTGAATLVELGSGSSEKTRLLLDALHRAGTLRSFVPLDVSESALRSAAEAVASDYPQLLVHGVVGDFTTELAASEHGGQRAVAFLGGTIGNLYLEERRAFLGALADVLEPGDSVLLGTDLVKSADRLISAYYDEGGVTEQFVLNSLRVLNRELGADFDLDGFSYIPFWDAHMERMDLRLRSEMPQRVTIPGADLVLDLASGEEIRVEISTKFRVSKIAAELEAAGLDVTRVWTDDAADFALTLATKG